MNNDFLLIGTIALIHLLAVMSPGPDFFMCCRNSLLYSRRTGIFTAIGFGAGIAVHITYCLAGLALVISKSIVVFNIIKILGSIYLIYIGLKSFFHKSSTIDLECEANNPNGHIISDWEAIKMGFLTNVLNPKASLFFLGLFSLMISPTTSRVTMVIISMVMVIDTILWFSLVAIFLTHKKVRNIFKKYKSVCDKVFGGILIALGLRVALSSK